MEIKYCLLHEVNGSLKWRLNLCVWVYVCVCVCVFSPSSLHDVLIDYAISENVFVEELIGEEH